ncbi:uncharacterized protein K452DRAFT_327026 [Aplosporella prunicola CBS 121167]|uniref:Amine oxidase domain-containing protein n=1 Tax=Aplosporella prunicola CBS 121167 TaxID=1176127 RepID=A0A6A6BAM1_9PEZI|nr:uncharacterized protein K452DRAFT_327026 [Aplosporella prunicola CBS 121167]KAF2141292.1 hypothetical protein K452DRAFT_327026 [Aplosporella prunicola CBS 121167]
MDKKRVAIVGSGISGLGALYALRNTPHEVHLYEAADRLGGHTNTVTFKHNGRKTPVDTGFILLNTATYPNFIALLRELKVETTAAHLSFGITRDDGAFEWAGTSLDAIFAQRTNLLRPSFWRMIFDIIRFNQFALDLLRDESQYDPELSIGEYLDREGYSAAFRDDYLIPMTACFWSTGIDTCALDLPALTLVRFRSLWNHHWLSTVEERPAWMTIKYGSRSYINALLRGFPSERIHLSTPVRTLRNDVNGKVLLLLSHGREEVFDDVVLACHGDQAMKIISNTASPTEREIMSAFQTTPSTAYLHSDLNFMPRRPNAQAACNYLIKSSPNSSDSDSVSLTYNLSTLHHIPASFGPVLLTVNPPRPPAPSLTQRVTQYARPVHSAAAARAQQRLPIIQGTRGIWYAGAWAGHGSHEDGLAAGVRVAVEGLGGRVLWEWKNIDAGVDRTRVPMLGMADYAVRVGVLVVVVWLWAMEACTV